MSILGHGLVLGGQVLGLTVKALGLKMYLPCFYVDGISTMNVG